MKVSWQEQALVDLDEALAYTSEDNPTAALKLVAEIFASVSLPGEIRCDLLGLNGVLSNQRNKRRIIVCAIM